ncbi:glycosyltransferase [Hymenobacter elongatus]|uniref:Glycosyltransferase subfamily 4-like N-terminal domain-containing protein n=1 Tax=Hymenobacter elongatus TaxID=877208 RepID=A0A4Z0PM10_9BACT|nr:glycosyltransferase [Hymenobacter elongatus]TGE15185.1 hypothetical protein E5J99_13335 [Hymenobacter elongatus]
MESHPLNVLLLGWDDSAPSPELGAAPTLEVSRRLAAHTPVSVIVPRLPESAQLTATDHVISLNTLSAEQLAAAATLSTALPGSWQAPAAPYAGASAQSSAAVAAAAAAVPAPPVAPPVASRAAVLRSKATTADATTQTLLDRDEFAEATTEIGPDEAAALSQPQNDLTLAPDVPATATSSSMPPSPAALAAHTSFAQALQSLDESGEGDLNFRVIQYARFAMPLALSQPFGVIYAAAWPAWLAALEIRQLTGRPLVLHVQSLAADRDSPADRGWILELERLALRRADLVLADTEVLAQRLVDFYSLSATRIRVVTAADTTAIHEALATVTPRV